jgi:hypothetical protein
MGEPSYHFAASFERNGDRLRKTAPHPPESQAAIWLVAAEIFPRLGRKTTADPG